MGEIKMVRKKPHAFKSGDREIREVVETALTSARQYREVSPAELHQRAVGALLRAIEKAATRNDHIAVASFSAALRNVEGGS